MPPQDNGQTLDVPDTPTTSSNTIDDPAKLGYTSGFRVYPSYRDNAKWDFLLGKARMDANGGEFWRIHDKLYDLTDFASAHPGGSWWIENTKGQDITELFESSHLSDLPERLLDKYYVGQAQGPRNSPFTFHEDGFYRTLKRKVVVKLQETGGAGPTWKTLAVMDGVVGLSVISGCMAAYFVSIPLAILAGIVLHLVPTGAHNLFHQRDSWRMYYIGLAQALTVEEFRSFHVLSHHPFPNTVYDADIFFIEPVIRYLAEPKKTWYDRWLSPVFVVLVMLFGCTPYLIAKTAVRIGVGTFFDSLEHVATFAWWLVYFWVSGSAASATITWIVVHHVSYGCTLLMGIASTHHHPENFHDGDQPRQDRDWGLLQLDATNDRPEYLDNIVLTSLFFGDHVLHHLFPTVDVSRLNQLYPLLFETCRQFNVPLRLYGQVEMFYKQFCQGNNNSPQTRGPERHQFEDYMKH